MINFNYQEEFQGVVSEFSIEMPDDANLGQVAHFMERFLVGAGYNYVKEVVIRTDDEGVISNQDDL